MTTIIFVIPSLTLGGAERVLLNIINSMKSHPYKIYLITFEDINDYNFTSDENVVHFCLYKKSKYDFFKLIYALAIFFKDYKPDIVVSIMYYANIVSIIAKFLSLKKFKLIISEHSNPDQFMIDENFGFLKTYLLKALYKYADTIVCVSKTIQNYFVNNVQIDKSKVKLIYNPLPLNEITLKKDLSIAHPFFSEPYKVIIAAGRLERVKRYDRLLNIFSNVLPLCKETRLIILGKGSLIWDLQNLAKQLNIDHYVDFVGHVNNPYAWISKAYLFVLCSDYEGFPMVILESMACGTPVVSTNCFSGPSEIITHGIDGILVPPDRDDLLAKKVVAMVNDPDKREIISDAGYNRARSFNAEKIINQYISLF